jgi:hypothetical protein
MSKSSHTDLGRLLAAVVAGSLAVVGVGLAFVSLLIWADQGFPRLPQSLSRTPVAVIPNQVLAVTCIIVGALLSHRVPRNAVGWLLLVAGHALVIVLPISLLVAQSHQAFRPASDLVRQAAWVESSLTAPVAIACLTLACLYFPDGRLQSRWQRAVAVLIIAATTCFGAATAFDPRGLVWFPTIGNPFAAPPGFEIVFELGRPGGALLMLAVIVLVWASLAQRYRVGDATTRAQLRWIVFAAVIFLVAVFPFVLARFVMPTSDAAGEGIVALAGVGGTALPVAAAFAITRYKLFGIDRLISRTLVYVPLVGILGGLYAVAVAVFQRLFVAVTGSPSEAPLLIAVFLIAAAFTPVRKAMEGSVDRWARAGPTSGVGGVAVQLEAGGGERSIAFGEPLAAVTDLVRPMSRGPKATRGLQEGAGQPSAACDEDELRGATATLAAVHRLQARVATQSAGADTDDSRSFAIDLDGTVDCPTGARVPFPTCLGCPYLVSISLAPPEVRCSRAGTA